MTYKESSIGKCPHHWEIVKFSAVAELKHGYQFRTTDFTDAGIKVFKITQINGDGTIDLSSCSFIDSNRLQSFDKNIINKGDILMALSGATIGKIGRYKSEEIVLQNYRVGNFMPHDEKILSKDYFYYFLTTDNTYHQILANQNQSAQENIGKEDIHNMLVFLPPLSEQKCIADTLGSLDNKIDLLQRQNKTFEALAEALFRQWFVEEADDDWEILKISDVASINKSSIGKNYPFDEIEYLDTGSITCGQIDSFQKYLFNDAPSRAQRLVSENDIVYSLVRPIQRHYGLLKDVTKNTVVSTGFCVISCKNITPYFIYNLLTQNETVEYFDMVAEGSTSTYPSLRPTDIADFEFQMPPKEILGAFHEIVSNNWNKIKSNTNQIKTLSKLRDALLPKLMSGEVRVKN